MMNEYDPTRKKSNGHYEIFDGLLKVAVKGSIVELPFKYSITNSRTYGVQSSLMPMENIVPTETIRTTNLTLPIAKDLKITLCDGREMVVETATKDIEERKGYLTNNPYIAWKITLKGASSE